MFKTAAQQVVFIGISVILTAFSLAAILNFSDPDSASWMTLAFFYLSLFLFTLSLLTILGLGIRQWLSPKIYILNFNASFRQALLLAALVVISFILLAGRLLFWWVELSLILFFLCVEIFLNLKI